MPGEFHDYSWVFVLGTDARVEVLGKSKKARQTEIYISNTATEEHDKTMGSLRVRQKERKNKDDETAWIFSDSRSSL